MEAYGSEIVQGAPPAGGEPPLGDDDIPF